MYQLNQNTLEYLLLGASVLATGGGCSYQTKKQAFKSLLYENVNILEAADLRAADMICTVYGVGPTTEHDFDFSAMIQAGAENVQKIIFGNLAGFFPGEIGVEQLPFQAAAITKLAVFDADGVGGRAVPEITQDLFTLIDKTTLPAVVVDSSGQVQIFNNLTPCELEQTVRDLVKQTDSSVLVFDHIISRGEINKLNIGSLRRSMELGKTLSHSPVQSIAMRLKDFEIDFVGKGKITEVDLDFGKDFLEFNMIIESGEDQYNIYGKNENLVLAKNGQAIVTCPHSIMLVDQNLNPVFNPGLQRRVGAGVMILVAKADSRWQSDKGYEIFGPRHFGYDFDVCYDLT